MNNIFKCIIFQDKMDFKVEALSGLTYTKLMNEIIIHL